MIQQTIGIDAPEHTTHALTVHTRNQSPWTRPKPTFCILSGLGTNALHNQHLLEYLGVCTFSTLSGELLIESFLFEDIATAYSSSCYRASALIALHRTRGRIRTQDRRQPPGHRADAKYAMWESFLGKKRNETRRWVSMPLILCFSFSLFDLLLFPVFLFIVIVLLDLTWQQDA